MRIAETDERGGEDEEDTEDVERRRQCVCCDAGEADLDRREMPLVNVIRFGCELDLFEHCFSHALLVRLVT